MDTPFQIRAFRLEDRDSVDAVVRAAWQELAEVMPGWALLAPRLSALTEKASESEVLVAESDGRVVGAVGYVGAHQPKPDFFARDWPIVRLMSVAPSARGRGVGRRLLEACIERARRDSAPCLALHTTPKMVAAQKLYAAFGFELERALPEMFGVPYVLMIKRLC